MQPREQPPAWDEIAGNFAWDGGMLVDLYVCRPATDGWDTLLRVVKERHYPIRHSVNGHAAPPPDRFEIVAAARRAETCPRIEIQIGSVELFGMFFLDDEVELCLDRSQVLGAGEFGPLCAFMRHLGDEARQPVSLAPENSSQHPFLVYRPSDRTWEFFEWRADDSVKSFDRAEPMNWRRRLRSALRAFRFPA